MTILIFIKIAVFDWTTFIHQFLFEVTKQVKSLLYQYKDKIE